MNCRLFERHVADWLGGRLAPAPSRQMAAHRAACPACAQTAAAEILMRQAWHQAPPARPARDPWPQISLRLETAATGRTAPALRPRQTARWAYGGAALLATVTVVLWGAHPAGTPRASPAPTATETAMTPAATVTLSALTDVGQVNPAVDDPVGTNMENVWEQIKSSQKPGGP